MFTQISGPTQGNHALFLAKHRLREANIRVAAPLTKNFILFNGRNYTFNPQRWSKYEFDAYYFSAIKRSAFHTVCNETRSQSGLIDGETALGIAAAMLYNKPIILTQKPVFDKGVDAFLRELIAARLQQCVVSDISVQSTDAVNAIVASLPRKVDYNLDRHERVLVRSHLKAHFRSLLRPTKKTTAYKLTKVSFV